MNATLLYRPCRRWLFWIALGCAAAIHIGAVVLARGKSDNIVIQDFTPTGGEVDTSYVEPDQSPPEQSATPSELVNPDEDTNGTFESAPVDLKFAAAVVEFGMILRDSEYKGNGTLDAVVEWAQQAKGKDPHGYRDGFIELVRKAQALKRS